MTLADSQLQCLVDSPVCYPMVSLAAHRTVPSLTLENPLVTAVPAHLEAHLPDLSLTHFCCYCHPFEGYL